MEYTVAFDITKSPPSEFLPTLIPFSFGVLGAVALFLWRHLMPKLLVMLVAFVVVFSVTWIIVSTVALTTQKHTLVAALREGRCKITEGTITNFKAMPYEGHQDESFTVGPFYFHYSDYDVRPDFHHSQSHGGPLRNGLRVRIHHIGNKIARLEIAE